MPHTVTPMIPNLYQLAGRHLHVSYSTSSFTGDPILTYIDAHQSKSFRGDEIRVMPCDLGMLVSVTLHTNDMGYATFSLLIPHMQIAPETSATVRTHAVTTLHNHSSTAQLGLGQLDDYDVRDLHGTAQYVIF